MTALGGLAAVIVGGYLLAFPGTTAFVLLFILALYWLISGGVKVARALIHRDLGWAWEVVGGMLSVIVGLVVLANPAAGTLFATGLLFVSLALAALFVGAISVVRGVRQRAWGLTGLGVAEVVLGVLVFAEPAVSLQILVPLVGIAAIGAGLAWMVISFQRT
jgi:uncharacterized membrane protein HdeD (DUF308 family)